MPPKLKEKCHQYIIVRQFVKVWGPRTEAVGHAGRSLSQNRLITLSRLCVFRLECHTRSTAPLRCLLLGGRNASASGNFVHDRPCERQIYNLQRLVKRQLSTEQARLTSSNNMYLPPVLRGFKEVARLFQLIRNHFPVLHCLVYCLIHAVAGWTFPAGGRGTAAGSLLSSHCPNYTWACVLCRPSPEVPFHLVWFLGWSTWHLALDPSSVLYLQHKLCSLPSSRGLSSASFPGHPLPHMYKPRTASSSPTV
jgi:hypothetical protein